MSRRTIAVFSSLTAVILALYVFSVLLISVYYDSSSGIGYSTRIEIRTVTAMIAHVRSSAVIEAVNAWELLNITSILIALAVFALTASQQHSRLRFMVFASQPFVLYPGLFGLLEIPFTVSDVFASKLDGEWLAEHWPTSICVGLWILLSVGVSYSSRGKGRHEQLSRPA